MEMIDNIKEIPQEYLNTPDHPFPLWDFAEKVTPDTWPYLYRRLAKESQDAENQISILGEAAKKLDRTAGGLWREFREYQKKGNGKTKLVSFRFLSVGELYSLSGPTDWLVKSYLDKGSLAMLFGKSDTLKSFAAIDMGLCVATGTGWHGNPVGQGTVFYICGEGQKGLGRRLRAWEHHHEMNLKEAPFFVSNQAAQFLDQTSANEVVQAVNVLSDKYGNPVLIIIDTLNRNFGPGDENNTTDMTEFVHGVDTNLRIPYGCTALIIHHTGHKELGRARGAYSLHAALDWEYQTDRDHMIIKLSNKKAKDFEPPSSLCLKAEKITLDFKEDDGKAMTSLILRRTTETFKKNAPLSGQNKIAYDTLVDGIRKNEEKPIHIDVWREAAYQAKISESEKLDTSQKAFKRAIGNLQEMGLIETKDDYWRPKPDTGQEADI